MRDATRRLADAGLLTLLVGSTTVASAPAGPAPFVVTNADGTASVDHPLTRKNHYPPGVWSPQSPWHQRWEFCFDQAGGGWTCLPVSSTDYQRYRVGDRVRLHQQVGRLAVITDPRKDRS
ncbi:hypothetical protein [Actinoplanes subglobosus]|uniref:Uncharacterized protein n=1 Tax=Actinoplanes subglobosus TaxID=1547892 RepID=A0ABV8IUU2_9ACTN